MKFSEIPLAIKRLLKDGRYLHAFKISRALALYGQFVADGSEDRTVVVESLQFCTKSLLRKAFVAGRLDYSLVYALLCSYGTDKAVAYVRQQIQ